MSPSKYSISYKTDSLHHHDFRIFDELADCNEGADYIFLLVEDTVSKEGFLFIASFDGISTTISVEELIFISNCQWAVFDSTDNIIPHKRCTALPIHVLSNECEILKYKDYISHRESEFYYNLKDGFIGVKSDIKLN